MNNKFTWNTLIIITVYLFAAPAIYATSTPSQSATSQLQFVQQMKNKYHIKPSTTRAILQHIQFNARVIKHISHPAEKHPWNWYQNYFITDKRITQGVLYWHKHARVIKYAAQTYGVDPSILVAIIGVETFYGRNTGHFNTLNSLGTLAFHYPPRSKFFTKELAQFIILCQQQHLTINHITGSYAGALGIPQFMPSSYRHYAVNYSHHDGINLFTDNGDAIVSVANYLHKNGWLNKGPVAHIIIQQKTQNSSLITQRPSLQHTVAWYRHHNISISTHMNKHTKAALIALDNIKNKQYWLIFNNFNAIMSYNPSINYAMAIYQLSNKIKAQHLHG